MAKLLLVTALSALVQLTSGLASTDTITWGGDNSRAGYQTNHNMDPAIVGSSDFNQIFKTALPGNYIGSPEQVFSQPLVYTPSDGNQYVYIATTQNNVYKLDAKTGTILLSRSLAIPFLTADLDGCVDINPTIGITSTGVIDPDTDTLYLTVKTYANQAGGNGPQGKPNGRYYVHALDVNDLSERANFPVNLEGIVARNNPVRVFNGGIHHQRPGLLHSGQYIYAGFASHCVQYNFTGWIMGFDKTSGAVVERYATEGDGVPNTTPGGGVWMSGGGLASDDKGSLFFGTGNGYASQLNTIPVDGRSPPTSLEEAAVHMTLNDDGSVTVVDFFMPQEKQALDGADKDLGTSPLVLLPSEFSCGSITRMGVITGKSGKTYFLNLDDLGGYRTGTDSGDRVIQVYQNENSVYAGAGVYPLEGGYIYINVIQYPSRVFKFSCNNGVPSFAKVADSPESNSYILGVSHGTVTSLNGQPGTGLVWKTDVQGTNLRIYDAIPQNGLLNEIRSFSVPGTTKFTRAVFGDGRLYMGTTLGYVYGFGGAVTPALNCTSPVSFGSRDISAAGVAATVTCKALIGTTVNALKINSTDFNITSSPTLPATLAAGATFSFQATFKPTAVGLRTGTVSIGLTNGIAGYASTASIVLQGTGSSAAALLTISPSTLTFTNVVIGSTPGGVVEPVVFSNDGNSALTISQVLFSQTGPSGPWVAGTATANGKKIGPYTVSGLPSTIAANAGATVNVIFDPTTGGTFNLYVAVTSNGGSQTFVATATAGVGPTCLVEFQTPDGLGWVEYVKGANFTFGKVTENTLRTLKMRVTNNGTSDAVPLSITVSKPPFGVSGIIKAVNQVDLAEGTVLAPGESATASMYCAVPKEQWDTDTYYGSATWTMNTNDPNWDKQYMQFSCVAVSEQAPPLQDDGQAIYRYVGCFKENNPGRQLSAQLYGSDNNSIPMCIAACAAGGYTYCGTQYGSECWAGNTIPVQKVAEADCNYPCTGAINQICGGNGAGDDIGGAFISLFATNGADTNSTTSPPAGPVVNPGNYGYVSIGCYHEPDVGRAIANQMTVTTQTIDGCLAAAAAAGYSYAGMEYGGECWAGNSLSTAATAVSLSTCSMTCNNNGSEYCGGPVLLNTYRLNGTAVLPSTSSTSGGTTTPTTTPSGPVINPGVNGYSFFGCYREPDTSRAFTNQLSVTNQTVGSCLAAAAAQGYAYAGIEYGGECWAGNSLAAGAAAVAASSCSMTCNNNGSEFCGGPVLLSTYKLNGTAVLPSTSSTPGGTTTPTTTPSGPVVNPGVRGYSFLGCYHEPATGRAFTNQLSVTNQTVGSCLTAAAAQGYAYAGIEYGGECWAGNSLAAGTTAVTTSTCSMTCNNNGSEYCGGPVLLSTYKLNGTVVLPGTSSSKSAPVGPATASTTTTAPAGPVVNPGVGGYAFAGCYHEPATGRALTNQISVTSQTVAVCIAAAAAQGFTYAGLEYGGECWAGNTLSMGASAVTVSTCNMPCNNNASEYCGGPVLMELYKLNGTAVLPTTSSSTAAAGGAGTTTTTTPAATVTGGPYTNPGTNGYAFAGCYHEPPTGRAFVTQLTTTPQTVANCLAAAALGGYTYAGLEYGGECWVGNTLNVGATQVATGTCTMTCSGNTTEYCGGSLLLDLYKKSAAVAPLMAPLPVTSKTSTSSSSNTTVSTKSSSSSTSLTTSSTTPTKPTTSTTSTTSTSTSRTTSTSSTSSTSTSTTTTSAAGNKPTAAALPLTTTTSAKAAGTTTSSSSTKPTTSTATTLKTSTTSTSTKETTSASTKPTTTSTSTKPTTTTSAKPTTSTTSSTKTTSTTSSTKPTTTSTSTKPTTTSTSTKTTAATTTSSKTATTSAVHTTKPTVKNWVYQGCYTEGTSAHALSTLSETKNTMTYEECSAFCVDYAYFGVENGTQCYCSNYFSTGSAKTKETDCTVPCAGDASELCGAVSRLNVYYQTGVKTGAPAVQTRVGNYDYLGCYSEATKGHALSANATAAKNMTEEACGTFCSTYGYSKFGVENATLCFCGETLASGSTAQAESQCSLACGGDAFALCGATSRLNVYTHSQTTTSTKATATTTAKPATTTTPAATTKPTTKPTTTSSTKGTTSSTKAPTTTSTTSAKTTAKA